MGHTLGLMCGAGVLPARMASEARRQGWRVLAFAFGDAPGLEESADVTVTSRVADLTPVLALLAQERASAALFAGKFWLGDVLREATPDRAAQAIAAEAGSLGERRLSEVIVTTLAGLGIEVLDQRRFLGDWLEDPGCWTERKPSEAEWDDVRRGFGVSERCAELRVGQTVVVKRGIIAAVEALEGTTAAVRRGAALAGPGSVVTKSAARDNDYRFDTPTIGPDTIVAAADGGVAVVAIRARRVLLLERDQAVDAANRAGIALLGVDDVGHAD